MRKPRLNILLVEDSADDVDLFSLALHRSAAAIDLDVVNDGEEAMRYLQRRDLYSQAPPPDMVLLDLNLPCKPGQDVLSEMKQDHQLKTIPVLILTTSAAPNDIVMSYRLGAACYLVKADDLDELANIIRQISEFWRLNEFPAGV